MSTALLCFRVTVMVLTRFLPSSTISTWSWRKTKKLHHTWRRKFDCLFVKTFKAHIFWSDFPQPGFLGVRHFPSIESSDASQIIPELLLVHVPNWPLLWQWKKKIHSDHVWDTESRPKRKAIRWQQRNNRWSVEWIIFSTSQLALDHFSVTNNYILKIFCCLDYCISDYWISPWNIPRQDPAAINYDS